MIEVGDKEGNFLMRVQEGVKPSKENIEILKNAGYSNKEIGFIFSINEERVELIDSFKLEKTYKID